MLKWLKEKLKKSPPQMLESEQYKIVKFDSGYYGVKDKKSMRYCSLTRLIHNPCKWTQGDEYFRNCQGSYELAKEVFEGVSRYDARDYAKEIK